jgi:arginyl-tRNA synthetase
VRANSILKKVDDLSLEIAEPVHDLIEEELALIEALSQFPWVVQNAARELKPLHLTNYLFSLAKSFNAFYRGAPVLTADLNIKEFRIGLVESTRRVLANGLDLLGIDAPDVM